MSKYWITHSTSNIIINGSSSSNIQVFTCVIIAIVSYQFCNAFSLVIVTAIRKIVMSVLVLSV